MRWAERLGDALRLVFSAMVRGEDFEPEWVGSINAILAITEGHDELQRDEARWKLGFRARHEGLEWLLAAIARSGAELIAEGAEGGLQRCGNANCRLLYYDHSRTPRRRCCSLALCLNRTQLAAFSRRHPRQNTR